MRLFLVVSVLFVVQIIMAETNYPKPVKSNKLKISVTGMDDDPRNWLRGYIPNNQKNNLIRLEFDINNVRAILITDMNAAEKKCNENKTKYILYLSFDPKINMRKISTRINKPCIFEGSAKLKLGVATGDDKRYYNTFKFIPYPYSSSL